MELRKISDKSKDRKGCGCFIIILIIVGFIVSVFLFGKGFISEIIHP